MKYILFTLMLMLSACSNAPKKPEYQNTFWIGCMNAYLHFTSKEERVPMAEANEWCLYKYESMREK